MPFVLRDSGQVPRHHTGQRSRDRPYYRTSNPANLQAGQGTAGGKDNYGGQGIRDP
jgi:hypothetical protein